MKRFNNFKDLCIFNDKYYMLNNKSEIEIFDDYCMYNVIKISSEYKNITVNTKTGTFYFYNSKSKCLCSSKDFKCFIPVKVNIDSICDVVNIYYCEELDSILINNKTQIFAIDLRACIMRKIFEVKERLVKINDCTAPLNCMNEKICLISTVCCGKKIYVIFKLGKKYYLSRLTDCSLEKAVYETCAEIKKAAIFDNTIWLLSISDCECKWLCTKIKCNCECESNECCEKNCDIIDSIAAMESSLAQILCSESLKIKEAIKKSTNISELLCANNSVNDVIYYITILEFILTEKLKTVSANKDCQNKCKKNNC